MIKKYTDLIEMLEKIFGKGAVSRTIGTRTNVVRFPKGKQPIDPTKSELDVEGTAIKNPDLAQAIENSIADRMGDITKMNDQELLTYTANVRRLVNFKEPPKLPEADVVKFGSGEEMKGKGLEELIEKEGLVASPKTSLGSAQFNIKRAEQEINKVIKENDLDSLLKGFGKDQLSEIRLHNQGLVRAVTRQILSEDIRAGKIKSLDLEKLGTSREPIDYFRKIYGEDALEQLDSIAPEFNRFYTEKEAADFAKTKFKFEPDETRLKGSMSYEELEKNIKKPEPSKEAEILNIGKETDKRKTIDELIDEYNANFDRTKLTDEEGGTAIGYSEFQDLQKRNEEIAKALEEKGIKSTIEEEIKPEGIVIPFRKKFTKPEPEEKADGGRIGYNKGKRVMSSIDKLIEQLNKKTKGKKSMESVNPKTGEVTVPKKPIRKAEEPTGMTTMDPEPEIIDERSITKTKKKTSQRYDQGMIKAANNIFPDYDDPKIAADQIAESYAQMKLGKNYEDLTSQEQNKIYSQAYDYVMDRKRGKAYKQGDPITEENFGNTPFAPDLSGLEEARRMTKGMSLEDEMNMVLNQYDKSMFVKNEQGMVDVTNPENVQKMALLLKKDHPELYRRLEAGMPQEKSTIPSTLKEFKKTSPEVYGEFSKSTNRMQELLNFRSGQETFETFDLETYNYLNSQEIGRLLNQLKNPYKISDKERDLVKTGFTRDNMEGTGLKNFDEINFRTDKKQLETYLDDLYNKKQIEEAQIELSDLQDSGREPNANGGIAGLL